MNANLTWEQSGVLALVLAVVALGLRPLGSRTSAGWARAASPLLGEAALIVALYSAWQLSGALVRNKTAGAFERGRWLLDVQRYLPLPTELRINQAILPHPWLTQSANVYYASMHFGAAIAVLVWLYWRHRGRYAGFRTVLALFTAISFIVSLVPVAPPRLIAGAGFVDTAEQYGQSVYTAMSVVGPNQLSAMPSVHVGWAMLVGVAVVLASTSRWRWLALAHPVLTGIVVVATANHYWLDGIVAAVLLAFAALLYLAVTQMRSWLAGEPAQRPSPVPAAILQSSTQS